MKQIEISGAILDSCDEDWEGVCNAEKFVSELKDTDDDIEISIDSCGGSVYGSRQMVFALARWCLDHPNKAVTVQIGSLCASAAANFIVALPRSVKVTAYANSLVMFHSCSGGAIGNPEDLRSTAEEMDAINESVQFGLLQKTTLPAKQIKEAFLAGHELWLTGKECLDCGLVTELVDGVPEMSDFTACLSTKAAEKYDISQIVASYTKQKETIKMEEEVKDNIVAEETEQVITAEATTAETEETEETQAETTAETEEETEETQECDEEKEALKTANAELTAKVTELEAKVAELTSTIEKYKPSAKSNAASKPAGWMELVRELNAKKMSETEYTEAYIALKNEHRAAFDEFMATHTKRH